MPKTFHDFLTDEEIQVLEDGGTVNKGFNRPLLIGKSFILHRAILVILIMRYARKVMLAFIVSTISR